MQIDRRTAAWSTALMSLSVVFLAFKRRRRAMAALDLKNKVVLITGGSRGLGFALASELAAREVKLVLAARDIEELGRAKARIVAMYSIAPADVFLHVANVKYVDDVRSLVTAATTYFGHIDVVINNAGIILVGPLESHTLESFQQAMDVNFYGALHTTLAVLPQMLSRGKGSIVNIASIGGKVAFPHLLPYVASKFALVGWSQGLRAELAQSGIGVTTVNPGIMRTGSHIQARYAGDTEAEYRWFAGAATFPGTAVNATVAARKVINALLDNSAEVAIGIQAITAARLSELVPGLTAILLATANRLLPDAPTVREHQETPAFWQNDHSIPGKLHDGSLPTPLEHFGAQAIHQYNQQPLP